MLFSVSNVQLGGPGLRGSEITLYADPNCGVTASARSKVKTNGHFTTFMQVKSFCYASGLNTLSKHFFFFVRLESSRPHLRKRLAFANPSSKNTPVEYKTFYTNPTPSGPHDPKLPDPNASPEQEKILFKP